MPHDKKEPRQAVSSNTVLCMSWPTLNSIFFFSRMSQVTMSESPPTHLSPLSPWSREKVSVTFTVLHRCLLSLPPQAGHFSFTRPHIVLFVVRFSDSGSAPALSTMSTPAQVPCQGQTDLQASLPLLSFLAEIP